MRLIQWKAAFPHRSLWAYLQVLRGKELLAPGTTTNGTAAGSGDDPASSFSESTWRFWSRPASAHPEVAVGHGRTDGDANSNKNSSGGCEDDGS